MVQMYFVTFKKKKYKKECVIKNNKEQIKNKYFTSLKLKFLFLGV